MKLPILGAPALLSICLLCSLTIFAQDTDQYVRPALAQPLLTHDVLLYQLRNYFLSRIAAPPVPTSEAQWMRDRTSIRTQFLQKIFHGWPEEWVDAPPKFEASGIIETSHGYRIRKFRYEVVPGFYSVALLYEPQNLQDKVPGILNVLGHDLEVGKSAEYMQKICINLAKQGVMALSLEWIDTGELHTFGNDHGFGAHLNLIGLQEEGLFYLAMRKGLDYLASNPNVDAGRLGVTGLSGGGWQTLTLGALDDRVVVAVPVAGYSSLQQRVAERENMFNVDLEQLPSDVFDKYDYTHLTALRAPRPTLLIHNVNDNCCFRAGLAKSLNFDAIRPIYQLFDKEDALAWYVNEYPGTHNYQRDNREQAYKFFAKYLQVSLREKELPSDSEIRTFDELRVGLPPKNLTLLELAQNAAREFHRSSEFPASTERQQWARQQQIELRSLLHYRTVPLMRTWPVDMTHQNGIDTLSFLFQMQNELTISGVLLRSSSVPENAPATLVLDDAGRGMSEREIAGRIDRGEQVLAANLLLTDESGITESRNATVPPRSSIEHLATYTMVFDTLGDRALGVETSQIVELTKWLSMRSNQRVRVETKGVRSQTIALLAAALEPKLFSEIVIRQGMPSFGYLLDRPVRFEDAADLFCLDLYKYFDIDELEAMAIDVRISHQDPLSLTAK